MENKIEEIKDEEILFPEDNEEETEDKELGAEDYFNEDEPDKEEDKLEDLYKNSKKLIKDTDIPQPVTNYEKEMWAKIDSFKRDVWDPNKSGFKLKDKRMDEALNGLQPGWHVIAGASNHGKSALLTDIEMGLLELNDNIFILSFTLDDVYEEKFARVSAILNKVTINFIRNPLRLNIPKDAEDDWYVKWENSVQYTKSLCTKYCIYDGEYGCDIDKIEMKIKEVLTMLEEQRLKTGVEKRLVVFIDSFHDLNTSIDKLNKDQDAKWEYIAKWARSLHTKYNIPLVTSAELKKLNAHRRPILDDIRDSIKIQFAAKNIMLVYNEVSQKSEGAKVFYRLQGETSKRPVLEVAFAKNKYTQFKGRLYYLFRPESVTLVPATKQNELKWNNMIFG
jgi:replicative DNA helicase